MDAAFAAHKAVAVELTALVAAFQQINEREPNAAESQELKNAAVDWVFGACII